jgi:DNA-binding IclR family transcriptional regulator
MAETKGVDAVERALSILECFTADQPDLGLADLARATGLYKSTILRLAVSLEKFGLLQRAADGRFRLGAGALRLGSAYRHGCDLAHVLRPELRALSDATGETASFYVCDGENRLCLYRSEPARAIRHAVTEGATMPLTYGASGKILRAYSDQAAKADAQILQDGYAISRGERDPDVAAISVPLFAPDGSLVGALALSGPLSRFDDVHTARFVKALRQSQTRLEGQLAVGS